MKFLGGEILFFDQLWILGGGAREKMQSSDKNSSIQHLFFLMRLSTPFGSKMNVSITKQSVHYCLPNMIPKKIVHGI